jgi:tRNA nucleotidyltransferase (CCA-adding enzyme)
MTQRAKHIDLTLIADHVPSAQHTADAIRAAGGEAYFVGGAVRDALLGAAPGDVDVATNLEPEVVAALFPFSVPTGIAHGTVTVWLERGGTGPGTEVTTYRSDGAYSDGRHPDSVRYETTIEADLSRRDFTVNAIAAHSQTGELVDPYGGQDDLARRCLRAVGDPMARFFEDGLRTMRAVRFAAQLDFEIETSTFDAITPSLGVVRKVAIERLRDELLKLLDAKKPSKGLELMRTSGLMEIVLPELLEGVGLTQDTSDAHTVYAHTLARVDAAKGRTARLSALFQDIAKPRAAANPAGHPGEHTFFKQDLVGAALTSDIMRRLRFSNEEREHIAHLVKSHMFSYDASWSDGDVRRFVGRVGEENLRDLFALREADVLGRGKGQDPSTETAPITSRIEQVLAHGRAMAVADLAVTGVDVMKALDIAPGKQVRETLDRLLDRVLEHPELNDKQTLIAMMKEGR